jgi:hypothetical protein
VRVSDVNRPAVCGRLCVDEFAFIDVKGRLRRVNGAASLSERFDEDAISEYQIGAESEGRLAALNCAIDEFDRCFG